MSQELMYTSVPRGLRPGSSGFCTAAKTAGMSGALEEKLELLSGYRALYPAGHREEANNPVAWAHWRVTVGRTYSVLSRVAFAGLDFTKRPSKFAHHLVLDASQQTEAGPAWVLMQGLMEERWSGEPRVIPTGREIPAGENPPRICEAWAAACGDAGWAGVLAEAFVVDAGRPAYVVYPAGMEMLGLIDEALALLPVELRWKVTFSTYFTDLPADQRCVWRCVVAGTPAATDAPRFASSGIIIDLTRALGEAPECGYVELARTGIDAEGAWTQGRPVTTETQAREEVVVADLAPPELLPFAEPVAVVAPEEGVVEEQGPDDALEAAAIEARPAARRHAPPLLSATPWALAALAPLVAAGMYAWHVHASRQQTALWEARVREASDRLAGKEQELGQEKARSESLQVDVNQLRRQDEQQRNANQALESTSRQQKELVAQLRGQIEQLRQEVARMADDRGAEVSRLQSRNAELEKKLSELAAARAQAATQPATRASHSGPFVEQSAKAVVNDKRASRGFSRASVIRPGELLELAVPDAQPIAWHIAQGEKKDRLILTSVADPEASFEVAMNSATGEVECDWPDVRARLKAKKLDAESKQTTLSGQVRSTQQDLAVAQQALGAERARTGRNRNEQLIAELSKAIEAGNARLAELNAQFSQARKDAAARDEAIKAMDSLDAPIVVEVRFAGMKVGALTITKD